MSDLFSELDQLNSSQGPAAALERLKENRKAERRYHDLFDAMLMKKKYELGLPVVQPTSFDDVPADKQDEFKQAYIEAARQVGQLFLEQEQLSDAWMYFRTINEPGPVRAWLDKLDVPREHGPNTDELLNVALYEGANPVKGFEMLLRLNGTCNTITTLDQLFHQLPAADRQAATKLLIRQLYDDLSHTLRAEVEQRLALLPPGGTLRDLFAGREWLFKEGNYHIDVSHLNAVVRFARSLTENCDELRKAVELAEYGSKLDRQYQYPGDAPFDDFYPAHQLFLQAVAGQKVDQSLAYFKNKLEQEPDLQDKPPIASVLIDLLMRVKRTDEALQLAREYAEPLEQMTGFSFARFCYELGRMDALKDASRERHNVMEYVAALVQKPA